MKKLKKVLLLITILFVVSITVFTVKTDGRYIFRAGLYVAGESSFTPPLLCQFNEIASM